MKTLLVLILFALASLELSSPALALDGSHSESNTGPETHVEISIFDLVKARVGKKKMSSASVDRDYVESVLNAISANQASLLDCVKPNEKLETNFELIIQKSGQANAKDLNKNKETIGSCVAEALGKITYPGHTYPAQVELEFPLKLSRSRL